MSIGVRVLKERIIERYDPDYLVDVLGITTDDLLDAFENKLLDAWHDGEFSELEDGEDDDGR